MATKKKLIEIDEKALEILEEQAKLQKRSKKLISNILLKKRHFTCLNPQMNIKR
tara:strand:+ start:10108 stop:10269 length:162 start_codon:yes stop_codon:yes gene_type:complete